MNARLRELFDRAQSEWLPDMVGRALLVRGRWWIAAGGFAALLLALLAVPYMVDVESYKPVMAEAVKRATGRELVIDGRAELSMLPLPHVVARKVRFSNRPGSVGAQMLDVRRISITPSLWALFQGRIEVSELVLNRPTIVLETDEHGVPNWEFKPEGGAQQAPGEASSGFHLTVGTVLIRRGTISYTNPKSRQQIVAKNVNVTASVKSLSGPFEFKGTADVNDLPLSLELAVGSPAPGGNPLKFGVVLDIGKLDFAGTASEISPNARLQGKLKVGTSSMPDFAGKLVRATGRPAPQMHAAFNGLFEFDGGVDLGPERQAINDFSMTIAGLKARGSLSLSDKPQQTLEGAVRLPQLDLDKMREAFAHRGGLLPDDAKAKLVQTPTVSPFPVDMNVKLSANVDDMTVNRGRLRDLALAVDIRKGIVVLSQLSARLPGDMRLRAEAESGEFSLGGGQLRETLAWLGIDTSDVPQDRLKKFQADGKFVGTNGTLQVLSAKFVLDDVAGIGGAAVVLGPPTTVTVSADMPAFDVDAYVPPIRARPGGVDAGPPPAAPPVRADPDATPLTFRLKIAKMLLRTELFAGVDADVTLRGDTVRLNNLRVGDVMGARVGISGALADLDGLPKYDLTVEIAAANADKIMGFMGVPVLRAGQIGPASLRGQVSGTATNATLRGVRAEFLGVVAQVTGTLSLDGRGRVDFSEFSLESADVSRFVAAASGGPAQGIGAVSFKGKLAGSMEKAGFTGDAVIHGSRITGSVDATLTGRPQITADLSVPGVIDLDKWLGISSEPAPRVPAPAGTAPAGAAPPSAQPLAPPSRPGSVTGNPIDVSALNAFDARLVLRAANVSIASLKFDNADLEATLRGGTLSLARLTGQFHGGALQVAGSVKTGRDGVALDFNGGLMGIRLADMLRGTAGKNTFGDRLSIDLDGRLDVGSIHVSGTGLTTAELRDRITGRATLGGSVHPSANPGSQSTLQFFAGLGGIFSDDLAAAALVLRRFINRENGIEGQVVLSRGVLATENLSLRGDGAQARINGRTEMATGVTDTTITFATDGNSTSNLVTTIKGALSAPDIDTDRVSTRR